MSYNQKTPERKEGEKTPRGEKIRSHSRRKHERHKKVKQRARGGREGKRKPRKSACAAVDIPWKGKGNDQKKSEGNWFALRSWQ